MKKTELNKDFDAIQIEEGDDIFFVAEILNKAIYEDETGNLYCADFYLNRVAVFNQTDKKWQPGPKNIIRELDNYRKLDDEEAMRVFKNNPPFDCFKEMENQHADKLSKHYLKLRKETKHEVIGWTDNVRGRKQANDSDDLYFAALLNDISKNQYDFSGDEMYLIPVFEDGTYLDFSSRGWGGVLAASRYQFQDMAYSAYTFMYKGKKYPEKGFYKKEKVIIEVSNETMELLKKYIEEFFSLDDEVLSKWYGANYIHDITNLNIQNIEAVEEIEFDCGDKKAIYEVSEIRTLNSVQELDELIDFLNEKDEYTFPELVIGDIDTLRKNLQNGTRRIVVIKNL